MRRLYFCLTACIASVTLPVSALGEPFAALTSTVVQRSDNAPMANQDGFYIDLPTVKSEQLLELVMDYRASLLHLQEEFTHYLDENRFGVKDVLIAIVMPGGLLYAAIRKGDLEQARFELGEITQARNELGGDLLAMQAIAGELTVARLQQ